MKRLVVLGVAALGVAIVARRAARHCGGVDFEGMIERMPEDAPPKWIYRNVSAIRGNTERILELLQAGQVPAAGGQARAAA